MDVLLKPSPLEAIYYPECDRDDNACQLCEINEARESVLGWVQFIYRRRRSEVLEVWGAGTHDGAVQWLKTGGYLAPQQRIVRAKIEARRDTGSQEQGAG